MKNYKDANGKIYAYEADGSQDDFIKDGLVPINDEELALLRAPSPKHLLAKLSAARKAQEQQGVTLNGIRYAGDPSNRQALQEAVAFMDDAGLTEFPIWKDSDDVFHVDHPLIDVVDAYRAIGARRVQLIAAEGEYAAQVVDGSLTEVTGLTWPQ